MSLLSTTSTLNERQILRKIQTHAWERSFLIESQSGIRADHSTGLRRMRLRDHVTLSVNNNTSKAAAFLDVEKAFDTRWHPGLPYKLTELEFSTILNKLIASFLANRKFKVLVEGELSASRETVETVQGTALAPVLYSPYTNNTTPARGTHLALFADDTCIYIAEKHERRVFFKLQRGLTAVKSWSER